MKFIGITLLMVVASFILHEILSLVFGLHYEKAEKQERVLTTYYYDSMTASFINENDSSDRIHVTEKILDYRFDTSDGARDRIEYVENKGKYLTTRYYVRKRVNGSLNWAVKNLKENK